MSILDWIIIPIPTLIVVWALLAGGIRQMTGRFENKNLVIGIFGAVLCLSSATAYSTLLSPPAEQMVGGQIPLLWSIGFGNLVFAIWSWLKPSNKSES
jgi:hypothetical protein